MSRSIDQSFHVPFVHRLRVTDDVAGADFDSLMDLLRIERSASPARVLVIAETILAQPARRIAEHLANSPDAELVQPPLFLAGGESIKNNEQVLRQLLDQINDQGLDRRSYVIAIGGGALLDAVGFATSIAHRGVRLIRLPSTVLAQADSGVGVKNAINYFEKKNWLGTFAVPWAVINDWTLLATLPDRDFCCGFSEAVKVALLKDRDHFDWLANHAASIRQRDPVICQQAIDRSCRLHLDHITRGGDPFEMLEARPLDFGHWSAHRLEPLTRYQLRHGEAVAIGVMIDCLYASLQFGFPDADVRRVFDCLSALGLKLWHSEIHPIDRLLRGLEEFRQHLGGQLTITMLTEIGNPINVHHIDAGAMKEAIKRLGQMVDAGSAEIS